MKDKKDKKDKKGDSHLFLFGRKYRVPLIAASSVLAIAVLAAVLLTRPKPVWLVDAPYERVWEQVLAASPPPLFTRVVVLGEGRELPRRRYGFIITAKGPPGGDLSDGVASQETGAVSGAASDGAAASEETEAFWAPPITIYPALEDTLTATGEYRGAQVLALDPWMVFRDFKDPVVSRTRVDSPSGGEGHLIMPGRDAPSVEAWTAQLLQIQPGVFPLDPDLWESTRETLFSGRRFQQGASTYGWIDAIPLFYQSSPAWIYAPLSRIRSLPPQDTSSLEASRFPEREDWHEFGLQADLLWAVPFGKEKYVQKLSPVKTWLASPETQTLIANTLGWIPAHRNGAPYNPVSRAARLAWLSSSFVWQMGEQGGKTASNP
ncbi:hypothetical protein TREPR_2077 [Treponema primitia ZAS-2]|uniref:Uncharacterized protein n=1 Tax=Treponema primitia (strain ATCC BAA-887 / DSM 12427 / ZAS-2) TaxID=545694 RepID=F5YJR3_TREPZ|nr:hypothetical protein [Treponema primitia]AEF86910.1 hypothetical protein TREPR_2077 [Treponema primitia ZAS-2]